MFTSKPQKCLCERVILEWAMNMMTLNSMNGARWVHKSEKIRETLELEPFQNHIAIWISFSLLYSTVLCALLDFWIENRCDFFMFVALPCVAFVYTFKCISFVFQWVECLFVRCAQKQKYMMNTLRIDAWKLSGISAARGQNKQTWTWILY